jgi:hypothetical protein
MDQFIVVWAAALEDEATCGKCYPPNSQNELLAPRNTIQNFAHYVELTAYPQRSALELLLIERQV